MEPVKVSEMDCMIERRKCRRSVRSHELYCVMELKPVTVRNGHQLDSSDLVEKWLKA